MDLESLDGFKVEAPGIFSFPALTDEFCELLLKDRCVYRLALWQSPGSTAR